LRVELAPLGVKVVTIVTGGVKSNIARTDRALPEGSYYIPLNAEYQRRLKHSQEGAMPNEAYAKSVVSHVLKKSPSPFVWEGKMAWVVWFAQRFVELIFGTAAVSWISMVGLWSKLMNDLGFCSVTYVQSVEAEEYCDP
jgi:1-acylglycerone phosphate reductase